MPFYARKVAQNYQDYMARILKIDNECSTTTEIKEKLRKNMILMNLLKRNCLIIGQIMPS